MNPIIDAHRAYKKWHLSQYARKIDHCSVVDEVREEGAIADRVAVINKGEMIVVDETSNLIKSLGQKTLTIDLHETVKALPESLKNYKLTIVNEGLSINYQYDTQSKQTGITSLLQDMKEAGLKLKDLNTEQSSLEKIFVELVKEK